MTKSEREFIQREFDQVRSLMTEHHIFLKDHVRTDDERNDRIAEALTQQNVAVGKAQQRLDSFISYAKWISISAGGSGILAGAAKAFGL